MVKKIIITGGLGYIGTELCKIYSGVSWHHKIIVIDNLHKGKKENLEPVLSKIQFEEVDIRDYNSLEKILVINLYLII